VHLCDFRKRRSADRPATFQRRGGACLELVTLGSAARNAVKIKVRQPLAEIRIQPGTDSHRRAIERFADQLCDELNIRKAAVHTGGPLLAIEVKPNRKSSAQSAARRLQEVCRRDRSAQAGRAHIPRE